MKHVLFLDLAGESIKRGRNCEGRLEAKNCERNERHRCSHKGTCKQGILSDTEMVEGKENKWKGWESRALATFFYCLEHFAESYTHFKGGKKDAPYSFLYPPLLLLF